MKHLPGTMQTVLHAISADMPVLNRGKSMLPMTSCVLLGDSAFDRNMVRALKS